jgi:hypothetical protein
VFPCQPFSELLGLAECTRTARLLRLVMRERIHISTDRLRELELEERSARSTLAHRCIRGPERFLTVQRQKRRSRKRNAKSRQDSNSCDHCKRLEHRLDVDCKTLRADFEADRRIQMRGISGTYSGMGLPVPCPFSWILTPPIMPENHPVQHRPDR